MCPKMAAILDLWPFGGHKNTKKHVMCLNECTFCTLFEIAVKVCARIGIVI